MAGTFWRGWSIVGFTFVMQFCVIGTAYYAFGVFLKPLAEALDADRFSVSLAVTGQTLVMGLLSPFVGRWLAEYSIRLLLSVGVLLMAVGFLLTSFASELWHLYIAFGLIVSSGMILAGPLPNSTLLANWFIAKRGTALGISQIGISISGTVLVPVVGALVLNLGWRETCQLFALALPLLLLPLILLLARRSPEDVGLHPDGADHPPAAAPADPQGAWTVRRALSDRRTWAITLLIGPSFMAIQGVVLSLYAHATDLGFTDLQAGSLVATATLFGAIAKPLFGGLTDYLNTRWVVAAAILAQVLGVAVLIVASSYALVAIGGALFGLGYGAMSPLMAVLIAKLFGRESFSRVMGAINPLMMPFNLIGFPLANAIYEGTGSYVPAFATLIFAYAASGIAVYWLRESDDQLRATPRSA